MIINVAHTKGGVGKTTIAVNLAIEMKSDLFDLDNQNSSYNFSLLSDINRPIHFWKDRNMLKDIIKTYRDNPGFRPLIRGFFFYIDFRRCSYVQW